MNDQERIPTRTLADALVKQHRLRTLESGPIIAEISRIREVDALVAFTFAVEAAGISYQRAAHLGDVALRYARIVAARKP